MRSIRALAACIVVLAATGCRSPYIEATVSNHTAQPIELFEVDYPSASFGAPNLASETLTWSVLAFPITLHDGRPGAVLTARILERTPSLFA